MPTLPWCVGPMGVRSNAPEGGVGVGVGTLLSSQIPQAPSNTNPNEINIQDSSAGGSGCLFISSEGALYVIMPYDYPAAQHPLFEHTPVLNNNFEY